MPVFAGMTTDGLVQSPPKGIEAYRENMPYSWIIRITTER
jgi:hypothetical protein